MKRNEAVAYLKEIHATCQSMSPDSVDLVNSKPDDLTSTGYQVHIQIILDDETKQQIRSITDKYSLALREEKGKVVIYQLKVGS